jgi:hypothetical protein
MVFASKGNVLKNCLVEQDTLLLDQSDVFADPFDVQGPDGITIQQYVPRIWGIEAQQKIAQSAFSRTTFSDEERCFTSAKVEGSFLQRKLAWPRGI